MPRLISNLCKYINLKDSWHVINDKTHSHTLTYNKSFVSPILTTWWYDLQKFHDFSTNVEVVFGYYGYNLFSVQIFKEAGNVRCIPKWHSRSTMPYETMHFDSHVWEYDFKNPMKVIHFLLIYFQYVATNIFYNIVLMVSLYI